MCGVPVACLKADGMSMEHQRSDVRYGKPQPLDEPLPQQHVIFCQHNMECPTLETTYLVDRMAVLPTSCESWLLT